MSKLLPTIAAAALALGASVVPVATQPADAQTTTEIGYVEIDRDISLRRMVVRGTYPKGIVLLLHGFPETIHAWQGVTDELGGEYEVHAFDWPGFGFSSRPSAARFGYSPRDYARVLRHYIDKVGIDRSRLMIYATDIGALPALLAALDEPDIARTIIVGDFAPFDRPDYMQERLQALKSPETGEQVRAQFNATRDEIIENAWRRGFKPEEQFGISAIFKADMTAAWNHGTLTTADAFARYYSHFTRDQNYFEASLGKLQTPVKIVWGARDIYIDTAMGVEFAARADSKISILPGIGHYPHLQNPRETAAEIRSAIADAVSK
ncbi:alpha/beta hydrolase [Sphingopyxis sp. Root214]|uniref:alpha/beta fold hydrolase n=1 Tax=unclassified Sphingopyxis TaxID=2614943 RepID=UPI0006F731A7|nr:MULTISPECIES: alpha/beta hydrolase [unclassified Sphingopyxis]KQZ76812.1 alpha/beta hydrolase [Sphingopyxis sp. Root154]KRC09301.1 alpha/beta hydrolase [Sphingopyxis sp. Root214]